MLTMSNTGEGFAKPDDVNCLKKIWADVFEDAPEVLNVFFDTLFVPENTVVYRMDGQIVSVMYLLPCRQSSGGDGMYIYAVATVSSYRGRGLSSRLLAYANKTAGERGYLFTVLVPSEKSLFDFYRKNGYNKTISLRQVTLSREELLTICVSGQKADTVRTEDIYSVRKQNMRKNGSYIEFPVEHLQYSEYILGYYGKKLLQIGNTTGQGYIVCDKIGNNVIVKELSVEEDLLPGAVGILLQNYPQSNKFMFCLPVNGVLFSGLGENIEYGLAQKLCENGFIDDDPFMSMVLD